MADSYVVASKVKEFIKGLGLQTSATALEALSDKVKELLKEAAERAKSNGRATVKDRDL